jgi:precorrin-4/cobalt-precorrin-4 C11-methyltransferase
MPAHETLAAFGATGATLAIHLAVHAIDRIVAELMPYHGPDCPVAVVVRASWPDERILRATLGTIEAELARSPAEPRQHEPEDRQGRPVALAGPYAA